jgi:signal transduction histidine kinase
MLRRLGIRGKVLAALAVPVLVLFAAATLISWQSIGSARVARSVSELVGTSDELTGFARAMQAERALSLAVAADPKAMTGLATARAGTDSAAGRLDAAIAAIAVEPLGSSVQRTLQQATDSRAGLPALRAKLDAALLTRADADASFTSIIDVHTGQAGEFANALADRKLASYLNAYGSAGQAEEAMVHELPAALKVATAGGADPAQNLAIAPQITLDMAAHNAARAAVGALRVRGLDLMAFDDKYRAQRLALASGNPVAIAAIDPGHYEMDSVKALKEIATVTDQVRSRGAALAQRNESAAIRTTALTIAATILTTLVSVLFALLVARQIVVPLRRLTTAADDLRAQLPTLVEQISVPGEAPELALVQIPVTSQDEVGRLAAAFNAANATTIHVAQEQAALRGSIAEMFVNVARRDQVLLNRQISFIDALEQSEENPTVLANLFRLDHLATRMRRNAESLLVLAGIDSGRRVRAAMPLSDVIRTASSEIEQYDRITLTLGADPEMLGFTSLPAAHLLAELLENATRFSEPETPVEVETSLDGAYVQVVVRDHGLGMSEADRASATEKIRANAASDVLGAQRLGLFVVGRLAGRLDAVVALTPSETGPGTVAVVRFPATLFEPSTLLGAGQPFPADAPSAPTPEPVAPSGPNDAIEALAGLPVAGDGSSVADPFVHLPRRPVRAEAAAAPAAANAGAEKHPWHEDAPADTYAVVLPPLAEATLSPELTAELTAAGDWAPEGPTPDSASALPSRAVAGRTSGIAASEPTTPPAPTRVPRTGLFAGFRGRVADAPPVLAPPSVAARAAMAPDSAAVADLAVPGLVPDAELAVPGLVPDAELAVRGLVPDAELAVPPIEAGTGSSVLSPAFAGPVPDQSPDQSPGLQPDVSRVGDHAPDPRPSAAEPDAFEPTLDEARAWGAGAPVTAAAVSWLPGPATDAAEVPQPVASAHPAADVDALVGDVAGWTPPAEDLPPRAADVDLTAPDAGIDELDPAAMSEPGPPAVATARPERRSFFGRWRRKPASERLAPERSIGEWLGPEAAAVDAELEPAVSAVAPAPQRVAGVRTDSGAHAAVPVPPASGRLVASVPASPRWTPLRDVTDRDAVRPNLPPATLQPAVPPASPAAAQPVRPWAEDRTATDAAGADGGQPMLPAPSRPLAPSPRPASPGALDDRVAAMLALRSDIQEQALAELGQLSAYRPSEERAGAGGQSLQRRVPTAVPDGAAEQSAPSDQPVARDAEQLRRRLSSFQSGSNRGRLEADTATAGNSDGNSHMEDA